MRAYKGLRNVSFSEDFKNELKEWFLLPTKLTCIKSIPSADISGTLSSSFSPLWCLNVSHLNEALEGHSSAGGHPIILNITKDEIKLTFYKTKWAYIVDNVGKYMSLIHIDGSCKGTNFTSLVPVLRSWTTTTCSKTLIWQWTQKILLFKIKR